MTTPPFRDTDPLTTAPTPITAPTGDSVADGTRFNPSTTDGADSGGTDSAKDVAQEALGSAADVAGAAKEEASKVASEAKDKATDLLADVKSQVDDQSRTQLANLASKLGELADEIESMVKGSDTSGTVTDVAQQLADRTHELSAHLDGRQPLDLLDDVRGFARRRPAAFLAGAAVAGVIAGRLTRGAKASQVAHAGTPTASTGTIGDPPTFVAPESGADDDAAQVPSGQNTGGRQ